MTYSLLLNMAIYSEVSHYKKVILNIDLKFPEGISDDGCVLGNVGKIIYDMFMEKMMIGTDIQHWELWN